MERIDFTAVDSGFHGHSIPFDLIANMINNDKPGAGLDLEPETEVKANRLVRMVGRKQKLSDVQHESSSICRKVIKTK